MSFNPKILKVIALSLTIVLFVFYFLNNQESFERIWDLSFWQLGLILLGQSLVILANTFILSIIVSFSGKKIPFAESAMVTAYSSVVNFFGFLQGGVGLRGIYLNKYFSVKYRQYFLLTAVQYILLFSLAGLMIFVGVSFTNDIKNALFLVGLFIISLSAFYFLLRLLRNEKIADLSSRLTNITSIFRNRRILLITSALVLQLCGSFLAYGAALDSIGADITIGGLLIFTGISQFSIVIALTPGAIGIREGLLLIAQSQMLLSANDIIVASTIDRAVYFITLALLVPIALAARGKINRSN